MYYDKLYDLGIKLSRRSGSEKTKCPQCSDGRKNKHDKPLSVNITTGDYCCHNCSWKGNVRSFERKRDNKKYEKPDQNMVKASVLKEKVEQWFAKRCISRGTLDKFMVFSKQEWMPQTQKEESCICFPYFRDGELVNIKFRDGAKNFKMVKDAELIFFNLQSIGDKKKVVIVEGEIDAMAVYEAGISQDFKKINEETGEVIEGDPHPYSEYAVVSVPNGASKGNQRLDYLDNCADWFIGLHEIVIATDNDEAGKLLKDELIRRLGVERCSTIAYPSDECVDTGKGFKRRCKDLNEVLEHFGKDRVAQTILDAELIPVDGVYYLDDLFESMVDNFKKGIQLAPTTRFREMDEYFRWKKGDITLVTGYGNHGKSFFMLQLMLTKSIYDGWKWAIFSPENFPANDFYDDIIEMYVGKWLNNMTLEEYQEACGFIDQHIFYVYPDDGHDINSINEKFRHLILKKGVDGVMVDPFNQLDSNQKAFQREDQYLSEVLKDVKRFALLNNVVYAIVAHPKTPSYGNDKSLPVADMYDISGGSQWGNKSDQIISYYRPRFHEDKNSPEVEVYIQKLKRKRTGGKLGNFPLSLNWAKKRYMESDGSMPCDPKLATMMKLKKENDYSQQPLLPESAHTWLPYKDENGTEIGF